MNYLQDLIDGMSARSQRERAGTQLTLGTMIQALGEMPPDTPICGLGELRSYRGYYTDLAFEPTNRTETAAEVLKRCKAAMGKVFEGYKGGDFQMGQLTPLWVAPYGVCGKRLMKIRDDGSVETAEGGLHGF
jgi:hypothetical protein